MRAFRRFVVPDVLADLVGKSKIPRWVSFGARYKANRIKNYGFKFQWPKVNGKSLNRHLLPTLKKQTIDHCSYCDGFPLGKGEESIDHFLPKLDPKYYDYVCQWENLYLACAHCQQSKGEKINSSILRPDEVAYAFHRYFVYDYINHEISVNPLASNGEQLNASSTSQLFDFNNTQLIIKRRHSFERYQRDLVPVINDYNFRFMFDI